MRKNWIFYSEASLFCFDQLNHTIMLIHSNLTMVHFIWYKLITYLQLSVSSVELWLNYSYTKCIEAVCDWLLNSRKKQPRHSNSMEKHASAVHHSLQHRLHIIQISSCGQLHTHSVLHTGWYSNTMMNYNWCMHMMIAHLLTLFLIVFFSNILLSTQSSSW